MSHLGHDRPEEFWILEVEYLLLPSVTHNYWFMQPVLLLVKETLTNLFLKREPFLREVSHLMSSFSSLSFHLSVVPSEASLIGLTPGRLWRMLLFQGSRDAEWNEMDRCTLAWAKGQVPLMSVPWVEPPPPWNSVLAQILGRGWAGSRGGTGMGTNMWVSGLGTSRPLSWERC